MRVFILALKEKAIKKMLRYFLFGPPFSCARVCLFFFDLSALPFFSRVCASLDFKSRDGMNVARFMRCSYAWFFRDSCARGSLHGP